MVTRHVALRHCLRRRGRLEELKSGCFRRTAGVLGREADDKQPGRQRAARRGWKTMLAEGRRSAMRRS
jgi:hypothetical protein